MHKGDPGEEVSVFPELDADCHRTELFRKIYPHKARGRAAGGGGDTDGVKTQKDRPLVCVRLCSTGQFFDLLENCPVIVDKICPIS